MNKLQKGFTLIELMIVVAIIAILAAIALPAYQDYVARSQVSEGASLASGAKTAVAEEFANTGTFVGITNTTAGLDTPGSINGKYVSSVTVDDGVISVAFATTAASDKISAGVLAYDPTDNGGAVEWDCSTATTTVDDKYLPSACRP